MTDLQRARDMHKKLWPHLELPDDDDSVIVRMQDCFRDCRTATIQHCMQVAGRTMEAVGMTKGDTSLVTEAIRTSGQS